MLSIMSVRVIHVGVCSCGFFFVFYFFFISRSWIAGSWMYKHAPSPWVDSAGLFSLVSVVIWSPAALESPSVSTPSSSLGDTSLFHFSHSGGWPVILHHVSITVPWWLVSLNLFYICIDYYVILFCEGPTQLSHSFFYFLSLFLHDL